jgi:general secretion pathway protein J
MKLVVGPTRRARSRGFTLLELLVAMFIAAILFAMGYGTISQAVKNREVLQDQQKRLADLQTTVRVMEQDFVQLAQRPIRDPVGGTYQGALIANANSSGASRCGFSSGNCGPDLLAKAAPSGFTSNGIPPLVALTRAGWTNPTGLQRPTLQRVAYYFEKGTLRRESWNVLDPTQTSVTVKRELLTNLKSVSLRFMDIQTANVGLQGGGTQTVSAAATWTPIWPPVTNGIQNNLRYRPIAVEITLETEDWGKIVRVVECAG